MSTRNEGSPALAVYLDNLQLSLRLRDGLLAFSALVRHLGGDRVTDPRE